MSAVADRMHGLLEEVAAKALLWIETSHEPGSRDDTIAHELLLGAILNCADEYKGFELIMQALHPSSPGSLED
jgi:hypothetical protein